MCKYFFLTIAIVFSFIVLPLLVSANLASDLQNEIDQKKNQIQELENQITQYKNIVNSKKTEGTTLKNQIAKLQAQIGQLETEIKLTQVKISTAFLKIQEISSDIATKNTEIERQKNNLGQILRTINDYDQENNFALILKNDNFSDFLNQLQYVDNLHINAQKKLENIKNLKTDLEAQKSNAEDQKNSLEDLKIQLKGKSYALDDQKDEKKDILLTTKNQEEQYKSELSDLQKKREQVEQEIFQIEEKLRQAINPNFLPAGKIFDWPIKKSITQTYGCILTSFAKKSYPACNNNKGGFHNGIDIDADFGDPIFAAQAGTVSGIGNLGKYAYGKWITIDHGNGLTTLYGHFSAQSVSIGQKVSLGQVIGYAGSTGYSTGSHLHFTVYATNTFQISQKWYGPVPLGGALNPLDYL